MRLLVTAMLIAAVATPAAASEADARAYRQALIYAQRGMAALEKGNSKRAEQEFRDAIEKTPQLPEAHLGLGHIAMSQKRFDDALREYRIAEDGHEELASLRMVLEGERYARSRDELQRLRDERGQLERMRLRTQTRGTEANAEPGALNAGQVEREIAELDGRIQALDSMNTPNPKATDETPAIYRFHEGAALFNLKRTEEAILVWESAAKSDPKFGPVYNNLAVAYWSRGRLDEAKAALDRADSLGFKVNPSFRSDLDRALTTRTSATP